MSKLTKRTIDAAKPGKRERFLWDSEIEGFGLRIFPSGRKSYLIQYRNAAGSTRRLTLGPHGKLTPAEARQVARERLMEAASGGDPSRERKRARNTPTVAELVERYLTEHIEPKRKRNTASDFRRLLAKNVLPELGHRKGADLELADVDRLHRSLSDTPVLANRVVAVLSSVLNMAEKWGVRPRGSNPCRYVDRFREYRRERYLSGPELARLGEVLSEAEQRGREQPQAILALRLLLLTGCRKSEILKLRWEEVDLERGLLLLPDSKTGAKAVPLGAPAVALLAAAPRQEGNPYVIPGGKPGTHFVALFNVWKRLRPVAGLEDVRLHDFRHSFASVGAGGGLSLPILGKILGHQKATTTARYAHLAADPVQQAVEQVSGEIAAALAGRDEEEVVNISKA